MIFSKIIKKNSENWSVKLKRRLPNTPMCWCNIAGFHKNSGENFTERNSEINNIFLAGSEEESDILLTEKPERVSEIWKMSEEGNVTILSSHPDGVREYVLGLTASFVWTLCDGNKTIDQIFNEVYAQFKNQSILSTLNSFFKFLQRQGLVISMN